MRRAVTAVAAACLLAGPTVLAFFSGGYFTEPRLVAAIVAWTLVLALCVVGPAPLPRSLPGRLAAGGIVLLTAWSALSVTWAPLRGPATEELERLVLYTGALLAAIATLRTRPLMRAVEPAFGLGAVVVIGYGLAGRLLPGLVELDRSERANGRLEQPITYWNAEGALAAMGLVLCARLAGDRSRPPAVRALAAAGTVPLGAGVYLSYSRGAIAVAVLGLAVLAAIVPSRSQLWAAGVALAAGALAGACAEAFSGVAALAILVLLAIGAALLTVRRSPDGELPAYVSRRIAPIAAGIGVAIAVGVVIGGLAGKPSQAELSAGAAAERLATASSNRYEYWRVAVEAFARNPIAGVGAGGFRVEWLRERDTLESVRNAHSLEVEIAAELGLAGLLALALTAAGAALAARRALRRARPLAAGWCAAALVWLVHASIDWDWQLPAVSLPAIVLAGALVALAEAAPERLSEPAPAADRAAAVR
jgi:O-Antigen ligase